MKTTAVTLQVSLMGQFRLGWNDSNTVTNFDTPGRQLLLAFLILHPHQRHNRRHLAFTFWPDSTEQQARTNLRKALHHLRHALPQADQFVQVDRQSVAWRSDAPYTLDVDTFETAVAHANKPLTATDRLAALQNALACYHGDLLPGHYDDWILARRQQLRQTQRACLEQQIQLLEERRDYASAAAAAQRLLQTDPLQEIAYRRLMRLQALAGNRAAALRTYHLCATTLQRELDISPGASTQEAYRQLLALETLPEKAPPARIPLVGRTRTWTNLQSAWERTRQRPLLTLLRGEAGIGKTRLAEELHDWAARQGIPTLHTACYASAASLPYAPIADWLRTTAVGKHLPTLADKWLREISRVLPDLLTSRPDLSPPGPMTASWQRQHLFTALARTVLHPSQPCLLILDDMQWCDPDTLEWLGFLLRFNTDTRFMLLGTVRTEEVLAGHPLAALSQDLQLEGRLAELNLTRLNMAETTALAAHAAGHAIGPEQAAALFAATEGVPLFVVEMARADTNNAVRRSPYSPPSPHRHDASTSDDWALVPDRVRAVLGQRLDNLSPAARELTELAAAIGRYFTVALLSAASDMRETHLVRALDEMWRQGIIREQGSDAYDFSHALLRQAAYHALSPARRRMLHGRLVTTLESLREAGHVIHDDQLGIHYAATGQTAAAIACYQRAAASAQRIFANREALTNVQRALALAAQSTANAPPLLSLHEQQGDILAMEGAYEDARTALTTAVHHTTHAIDHARLLRKQGDTWVAQQQQTTALACYDDALHHLGAPPQPDTRWQQTWLDVQLCRGNVFYFSAQLADLDGLIEELEDHLADPALCDQATPDQQRRLLDLHNMLAFRQKRYRLDADDVARTQRILALARRSADASQIAAAQFALGFAHLWADALEPARQHLTTALTIAGDIGYRDLQNQCLAYLAVAYRIGREPDRVAETVAQHRPIAARVNNPFYLGILAGNEAWLSYWRGDWTTAVTQANIALDTWASQPYPLKWIALWPLLAAAVAQERLDDAVTVANQLMDPAQQRLADEVTAVLQEAVSAWKNGAAEACRVALEAAVGHARRTGQF